MKKVKLIFMALSIIAISSAFVTRQSSRSLIKKYHPLFLSGMRLYVEDVTSLTSGLEYDCYVGPGTCTFITATTPSFDPELVLYYFNPVVLFLCADIQAGEYVEN